MNEPLEWKDEYSVGVEILDNQHKGLIELINRLASESSDTGLIGWVFEELEAYTKDHFSTEEKILRDAGYEGLKAHRKEHKQFEQWLAAVRKTHEAGQASSDFLVNTVSVFLHGWLVKHILSSDMSYSSHLSASKKKGELND